MYTQDKILNGGEVTSQGDFTLDGSRPFYIFLAPKSENAGSIAILNVRLTYGQDITAFPFLAGAWNPVVLDTLNVSAQNLADYRIFYGTEK